MVCCAWVVSRQRPVVESYDDLWERIRPMTEAEQAAELLCYFSAVLHAMTDDQLYLYHHVIRRQDGSRDEAMMLDIVEGQIALRRILMG